MCVMSRIFYLSLCLWRGEERTRYLIYNVPGVRVRDFPEGRAGGQAGEQDEGDQSDAEQPQQDHGPHRPPAFQEED